LPIWAAWIAFLINAYQTVKPVSTVTRSGVVLKLLFGHRNRFCERFILETQRVHRVCKDRRTRLNHPVGLLGAWARWRVSRPPAYSKCLVPIWIAAPVSSSRRWGPMNRTHLMILFVWLAVAPLALSFGLIFEPTDRTSEQAARWLLAHALRAWPSNLGRYPEDFRTGVLRE
jgi:hypothetical protein